MKKCNTCLKTKPLDEFRKHASTRDKRALICKPCISKKEKDIYRNKEGFLHSSYKEQKRASKKKGLLPPDYTREEFITWVKSQPNYQTLYDKWVDSNYDRFHRPTVGRKDVVGRYTLDNIVLDNWKNILYNINLEIKKGVILPNNTRKVTEFKNGIITDYDSISMASRASGMHKVAIRYACNHSHYNRTNNALYFFTKDIPTDCDKREFFIDIFKKVSIKRFGN